MKKILSLLLSFMILSITTPAFANVSTEHMNLPKKLAKKTPTNIVNTSDTFVCVLEYNTMQLTFAEDFKGKTAKVGDEVPFLLENGAYTKEGTQILPPSSKVVAKISALGLLIYGGIRVVHDGFGLGRVDRLKQPYR